MAKKQTNKECHCGSGKTFDACCAPLIRGEQLALSADELMRSRYSAYAEQDESYLLNTWHTSTRPDKLSLKSDPSVKWTRLQIINSTENTVEFTAWFKINGKADKLYENSRFIHENGRWFYLDASQ